MIFHIAKEEVWASAVLAGTYHPDSLQREGYIHCSSREQLLNTAKKYFSGQVSLLVLCIAEDKVIAPIIFEDSYGSGQNFPHIYGQLNLEAVMQTIPLSFQDDGTFGMPGDLPSLMKEAKKIDETGIPTPRV